MTALVSGERPFIGSDVLDPKAASTTPLAMAWADTQWARYADIDPDIIRTLLDPWRCPAAFLRILAYAFSVDVWDETWPEATKRAVIAASPEVHRTKGTVASVERALAALGLRTDVVEWWQFSPPRRRGTFIVRVTPDGTGPNLDLPMLRLARLAVRRAKPKSRVFTFEVSLDVPAPIFIGGTTTSVRAVTLPPQVDPLPPAICPFYVAGFYGRGVRRVVILPEQPGADPLLTSVFVAAAFGRTARPVVLPPYSP